MPEVPSAYRPSGVLPVWAIITLTAGAGLGIVLSTPVNLVAMAHALAIDAERVLSFAIANCSVTQLDHIYDPDSIDQDKQGWRVNAVNLLPRPPHLR